MGLTPPPSKCMTTWSVFSPTKLTIMWSLTSCHCKLIFCLQEMFLFATSNLYLFIVVTTTRRGVWEQGAEENIWTYEGWSGRGLEKITHSGAS
jgi:hypothetical protein